MEIRCNGCLKTPEQFSEYVDEGHNLGLTATEYVQTEEGTYNKTNGHFLCTDCYIVAGMPSTDRGWVAP